MLENCHGGPSRLYRGKVPPIFDAKSQHDKRNASNSTPEDDDDDDDLGELRMGTLYDLTEDFLGKRKDYFSAHVTWNMRQEPRFRRYQTANDTNILHLFALNDAPNPTGDSGGQHRREVTEQDKKPMGDGVVNDEWRLKYRSAAFSKITVYWSTLPVSCPNNRTRAAP